MAGTSATIRSFHSALPFLARSDVNVLLCGEPGTGKRSWAQTMHDRSARQRRPFLTVRLSSLDATSMETKLFGGMGKEGLLSHADGGTVYLEDVEALTPHVQQQLTEWLGAGGVDVRLMSGTTTALDERVRLGRFARSLYGRLAVLQVTIPPLRDRLEDIPAILEHCLSRTDAPSPIAAVEQAALEELLRYSWPENTRELVQIIEAARAAAQGNPITAALIRGTLGARPRRKSGLEIVPLEQLKSEYILTALALCNGNQSLAARRLGIGRSTLIRKLRATSARSNRAA